RIGTYSILGIAARKSSVDLLRVLVKSRELDINTRDAQGNTANLLVMLSNAPVEQKTASLRVLIEHGCDPMVANAAGETVCSIACKDKEAKILEIIRECKCEQHLATSN